MGDFDWGILILFELKFVKLYIFYNILKIYIFGAGNYTKVPLPVSFCVQHNINVIFIYYKITHWNKGTDIN